MWITKNYSGKIQQEYKIESKLLEIKGIRHNLEIFNSKTFESIALIDEQIFLKTMLALQSELLAHICACSHQEPKRVLIADNFNLELAFEFLRYSELKVDFLQFDLKILESLISFFPHYQEVMKNANFKLIPQQQEEFLEQNEQRASLYDIIIATDESQFHCYKKLLSEDGILVLKIPHLLLDISKTKEILESLGEEFRIKMPFYIPMSLDMQDFYIFASKKYHPTADIILQRADMLEDLEYYNANLHLSAFVLPQKVKKALVGIACN
ncbi:spermidine synthase [Helicobacter pullorum]|uniref:Polyamine aminopropyltransferase n=1 Tax=Helicobacter pullorum TaxID=35818 RepID=A0AAW3J592_9HELI|nr:spermidine synthase [Helicobacter pullorum]KPH50374.1 spermidine synthase [Helicobacter pullorum]VEJ06549.1 spermidine synthase [Helicobacter pullorum]